MTLMTLYLVAGACLLGMLWNYKEREWVMFSVFLVVGFFAGLAVYFRFLGL